jgi:hypothetical protein
LKHEPELLKEKETQTASSELPKACYIIITSPVEEWAKLRKWNQANDHLFVSACSKNEIVIVNSSEIDRVNTKGPVGGDKT